MIGEVDVVGADTSSHAKLEVRGLRKEICSDVGRPERLGDDNVSIGELLLELATSAVPAKEKATSQIRDRCSSVSQPSNMLVGRNNKPKTRTCRT